MNALETFFGVHTAEVREGQKRDLQESLSRLTDTENLVLRKRFGLRGENPHTQVEVGQEIGRHRTTVGRIEKRAVAKLRYPSGNQNL